MNGAPTPPHLPPQCINAFTPPPPPSHSQARDLDPEEPLTVNADFTSKLLKVKVPLISAASLGAGGGTPSTVGAALDETEEESLQAQIASQRKTMVEASVVRIMKARKSLDLGTLVAEVMRQLAYRFEPTTADIKKRIEDLIERDYLERDGAWAAPPHTHTLPPTHPPSHVAPGAHPLPLTHACSGGQAAAVVLRVSAPLFTQPMLAPPPLFFFFLTPPPLCGLRVCLP